MRRRSVTVVLIPFFIIDAVPPLPSFLVGRQNYNFKSICTGTEKREKIIRKNGRVEKRRTNKKWKRWRNTEEWKNSDRGWRK